MSIRSVGQGARCLWVTSQSHSRVIDVRNTAFSSGIIEVPGSAVGCQRIGRPSAACANLFGLPVQGLRALASEYDSEHRQDKDEALRSVKLQDDGNPPRVITRLNCRQREESHTHPLSLRTGSKNRGHRGSVCSGAEGRRNCLVRKGEILERSCVNSGARASGCLSSFLRFRSGHFI
jgi:hypothetical protein